MKTVLSVVIPCYNEYDSLSEIILKCKFITTNYPIQIILINNGSNDKTDEILSQIEENYKLKVLRIEKNKGYGYGIKYGLKFCSGEFVGWTHADLQTDIFDCIKALNCINSKNEKIFIKGLRYGRPNLDKMISKFMDLYINFLFFSNKFKEVNAQPSIYPKSIKADLIKKGPDDYIFDFYAYYLALKANLKPVRFKVLFIKRQFGWSHWNKGIISKINFIKLNLISIFKYRFIYF